MTQPSCGSQVGEAEVPLELAGGDPGGAGEREAGLASSGAVDRVGFRGTLGAVSVRVEDEDDIGNKEPEKRF